jgi:subtilisin family serine protease
MVGIGERAQNAQFDPALKQLLLRKTGDPVGEAAAPVAGQEVAVVARLVDPSVPVPSLTVISRFGHVVTGRVPFGRIVAVRRDRNVASLKASQKLVPTLAFSVPEIRASADALREAGVVGVTGRGVVVGIVDWGCDFAHANFRDKQGRTRLIALWDQRGGLLPESPEPFRYGRELTRDRINEALESPDPYAALGYDPADADPGAIGTHGTHVLDIAAGNGSAADAASGVAPQADLIFVHLKGEDTLPEDTLGDSARVLEAVRYIFDRAADQPAVLNLSLGRTGGPHDTSPLVVQGLDALVDERPGRAIVMSAGNYYEADLHSSGRLEARGHSDLQWRVTPSNDEIAEMEIWYPGSDVFGVELIDPTGRSLGRVELGEDRVIREGDRTLATLFHRRHDPNNGDHQIDIFLWPDSMIGTWVIRLHAERISDGRYHAWIERDDPELQSRFVQTCATPTTTTGSICNGVKTIAVGAYDARAGGRPLVSFSSAGPTRDGRPKPDLSAPGAGIRAARSSRPGAGLRATNSLTTKSGTSMAAPHVTGTIALMFEAAGRRPLTAEETRQILVQTARQSPPDNEPDRLRYGAGRLDVAAAIRAVRALRQLEKVSLESLDKTVPTRENRESDAEPRRIAAFAGSPQEEYPSLAQSADARGLAAGIPKSQPPRQWEGDVPGPFQAPNQSRAVMSCCPECAQRSRESGKKEALGWLPRVNRAGADRDGVRFQGGADVSEALRRLSLLVEGWIGEDMTAGTAAERRLVAGLTRVSVALTVDDGGAGDVLEFRRRAEDFADTYGAVGLGPDGQLVQGASGVAVFRNNDELIVAIRSIADRLRVIGRGRHRIATLAVFTHGSVDSLQTSLKTGSFGPGPRQLTTQPSAGGPDQGLMYKRRLSVEDFTREVATSLGENVRLILYACAVGSTLPAGEPAKGNGGHNSLASRLAGALYANGITRGEVWAHTNYAHTTCNPNWRRFPAAPAPPTGASYYRLVFDESFRQEERRRLAIAQPDSWFLDHTYLWYVRNTNINVDAAGTNLSDGRHVSGAVAMHVPLDPAGFVRRLRDRWRVMCPRWSNPLRGCA